MRTTAGMLLLLAASTAWAAEPPSAVSLASGNRRPSGSSPTVNAAAGTNRHCQPIPDRLVVLTFDDSVKSHFTVVRPILKKHKFGATFFITEGFEFKTNKLHYMAWEEILRLHEDGFEIGNHTRDHMGVTRENLDRLREQVEAINRRCLEYGIPKTVSFGYPGNAFDRDALPLLAELGIRFARRGGAPEYPYKDGKGFAYEPGLDHPLLIPSAGDARPTWTLDDFRRAVEQAEYGRIAVLQFHGVPDLAHRHVHCPVERFQEFMQYLADNDYTVIALGDLEKYVDSTVTPSDPFGAINDRRRALEPPSTVSRAGGNRPSSVERRANPAAADGNLNRRSGESRDETRTPKNDAELSVWLKNMLWHHRYTTSEIRAATGLSADEAARALEKFGIRPGNKPKRSADSPLLVLPYPGGRHPRIGFLDGAIRPQRETKFSVFLPWDESSYLAVDVPEAIRRNDEQQHGLLYLAHTHVDTMWTKQGIALEELEWQHLPDGALKMERRLPNDVVFGTIVRPGREAVRMEMWLTNGSDEPLSKLRVQNCVMFKGAPEFAQRTNENKIFWKGYAACRSNAGDRWVIVAWNPGERAWANAPCPCMHSDPKFPDCAPGETKRLQGWLSFYQGADVEAELERIEATGWH